MYYCTLSSEIRLRLFGGLCEGERAPRDLKLLKRGNVGFVTLKLEIVRWIVLNNKTKTKKKTTTKTKRACVGFLQ